MDNNALLHLLGLARRSGRLIRGFDAAESTMRSGVATTAYLAKDVSERTRRNVLRIAEECNCATVELPVDMATLGHAIGSKPTGVLALTDSGFIAAIRKQLPTQTDDTEV